MTRQTFDLIPIQRFAVGFDQLINDMDKIMNTQHSNSTYPPYNIIRIDSDSFLIEIAVAGFNDDELDVSVDQGQLIVTGSTKEDDSRTYMHKGIAARSFTRTFRLDHFIEVIDAKKENGLLVISLTRVIPEELKPRRIAIKS
jgi:molecular chaperone IbpA